jgi:DNA polymerase-3 subunit gamma/tau
LFGALMGAELPRALTELRDQYDKGADPATVLGDLAEFTHFVTRVKAAPALAEDVSLTEQERTRGRDFAAKLSMRVLARTWQMLLKGIEEVQEAGRPLAAAEMVLVRIAYAADLPTPDEAIRLLADSSSGNGAGSDCCGSSTGASGTATARRRFARCNARGARAGQSAGPNACRSAGGRCRRDSEPPEHGSSELCSAGGARRRKARPGD